MKQEARSSAKQGRVFKLFYVFSGASRERISKKCLHPPDRPRPTLHPSIRPPAAFSCSHPEAGVLRRQLRRQIRPPSNHGRSVARSGHWPIRDFSSAPLAAKRRRRRKEGALLTHASPAPHVRSSLPPSLRSLWGRRPPHNTARLKPHSARSVACSVGRMQKHHHHHRLRPPSGSANMAQTDELVLAFAFASASKWGSEIDAEEEGGSPAAGCLPA